MDSLDNLIPGRKPSNKPALDAAGRALLVAAIGDAISADFADDAVIRFQLCKVDDFEVTAAVRAAVIEKKALEIFGAMISIMKKELENKAGGVVSINGFARFSVDAVDDGVEAGFSSSGSVQVALLPTFEKYYENRSAVVTPGNWTGGAVADKTVEPAVQAGQTTYYDGATASYKPWTVPVLAVAGSFMGVANSVTVTASEVGGAGQRIYVKGGLNIKVFVSRELVQHGSGDQGLLYKVLPGQLAKITAERVAAGWSAEYVAAEIGRAIPMSIDEWGVVAARGAAWPGATRAAWEDFVGVPASGILAAYPRRVKMVRHLGQSWEVHKISMSEFKAHFSYQENYLLSVGAWPADPADKKRTVQVLFRPEFIDAVQAGNYT